MEYGKCFCALTTKSCCNNTSTPRNEPRSKRNRIYYVAIKERPWTRNSPVGLGARHPKVSVMNGTLTGRLQSTAGDLSADFSCHAPGSRAGEAAVRAD